jgi:signal transduction histidine kinase
MGLGLSGSRAVVQQMGGTVTVSSEVGKGTTFTVTLPIAARVGEPSAGA